MGHRLLEVIAEKERIVREHKDMADGQMATGFLHLAARTIADLTVNGIPSDWQVVEDE